MTLHRCIQPPTGPRADAARVHRAGIPVLTTARLRLRAPDLHDFPLWHALNNGPETEFLGGPFTDDDTYRDFCVYVASWMLQGHGLWLVETHAGDAVGFITFGIEWDDFEPEMGWIIAPEARGQGFATEAAEAARDFALALYGPGQVVSYVSRANAPSRRLAERLGAVPDTGPAPGSDSIVYRFGDAA